MTATIKKIGVVIPARNRKQKTIRCLRSLFDCELTGIELRVIVVDDGSSDGTKEAVLEAFPSVEVIRGSGELYWTGAINHGIAYQLRDGVDFVLILNDDTIHEKGFLRELLVCAEANRGSIVGAVVLYLSRAKVVRFAGATWSYRRFGWWYPHDGLLVTQLPAEDFSVPSINGNCCLVPAGVIREHGALDDENLPHYYADTDYTIRLKRAGVPLKIAVRARVWDDDSDIASRVAKPSERGVALVRRLFCSKNSAYYWRAFFVFHWRAAPSKIEGMSLWTVRMVRVLSKVIILHISDRMRILSR